MTGPADPSSGGGADPTRPDGPQRDPTQPGWAAPIPPPEQPLADVPVAGFAQPAGQWSSAAPVDPLAAPPKKRPKAAIIGALGIGAALIATVGGKFLLGFLAASVVGSAVSGLFGGPWDRLPSDARNGYQQRLEAAVGNRLDGLSEAAASKKIETWLFAGYLRLDDGRLIRHLELEIEALGRSDEATCAAFGRQSITGTDVSDDTGTKMIGSLQEAALVEWIGLNVDALEAELRGSPDPTSISDAESGPVFDQLIGALGPAEVATFAAVTSGGSATDAEVCTAVRTLYSASLDLDPISKAIMARIDVQQ